jgi:hypothetical protein
MDIEVIGSTVAETNAVAVTDKVRAQLVADLGPVADRIPEYELAASVCNVRNQEEANLAGEVCDRIAADVKLVTAHETLTRITTGLHQLHRKWVSLRSAFVDPLEASRKQIKDKVIKWTRAEEARVEAEQRRLQAEADERARREQAKLEKEAAKLKTPELREQRMAEAAAVVAPIVHIEKPKATVSMAKRWKVKSVDHAAFFAALATRSDLRGYVEISTARMERSKAANNMMEIPGVEFVKE